MEIILLERVEKLGQMGDVVRVKDGFARNFLLPRGKALRATKTNLARFEAERVQLEARNLELKGEAEALGERLEGQTFVIIRQSSESGQLYGSVSARDVAAAASEDGFSMDKGQVRMDRAIKTLGLHPLTVVLHPEVSVSITVNVARTADEAERQAAGERVLGETEQDREGLLTAEDMFDPEALEDGEQAVEEGQAAAEAVAHGDDPIEAIETVGDDEAQAESDEEEDKA